jgi:hypothetical protein
MGFPNVLRTEAFRKFAKKHGIGEIDFSPERYLLIQKDESKNVVLHYHSYASLEAVRHQMVKHFFLHEDEEGIYVYDLDLGRRIRASIRVKISIEGLDR